MQKLLFYSKNGLSKDIDLSKLGFIIRKLNQTEYNELLEEYNKMILVGNDKKVAQNYYDWKIKESSLSSEEKINLFESVEKLGKEKEDLITSIYSGFVKNVFDILNTKNIKKELNNFLIVELNTKEFNKHFSEDYMFILLPKIINFSNYVASEDGHYEDYSRCAIYKYEDLLNNKEVNHSAVIVLMQKKYCTSINEEVMFKLQNMFKIKDKNFAFSFLMIIDSLLEDNVLVENRIINKISFLERLLISKEDNKVEAFVLKVGILCNKLFDISNESLSKRLKEIYNIRSMLVHGEENKIIDNIDYYQTLFSDVIEKKESKYETRFEILIGVDCILNIFFIRVLDKYLTDPNLCEYIKQN